MNKIALVGLMLGFIGLTACGSEPVKDQKQAVGMANPASVYCKEKGGKSIARKDADGGEYALCQLPNGQIIEEWELYRKDHK